MTIWWRNFRRRRGDSHLTIQRSCENLKKSREFLRRPLKKRGECVMPKAIQTKQVKKEKLVERLVTLVLN